MLDSSVYEEVEEEYSATKQALVVVILSSLAAGLSQLDRFSMSSVAWWTLMDLGSWVLWAVVTGFIGTKLLAEPQTDANFGQMLRTIGFASAPGILRPVGMTPLIGPWLELAISFWLLAAMVVAVRQALDYTSTWRAIVVCLIGWILRLALSFAHFWFY